MASFNRVILVGNLTRDPQLKYLPSNMAVCEIGLAVNHRWRDKEGNQRDEVCFVDVAIFGRGGEIVNQYMTKGRSILIEGRLKLDQWTAQDGTKRSRHSVVAENFTFLGDGRGGGERGGEGAEQGGARESGYSQGGPARGGYSSGGQGRAPAQRSAPPQHQQPREDRGGYESAPAMEQPPSDYDERPPGGDDIPF